MLILRALTEQHDRRERLIKISRDITIGSKRLIFHCHRLALAYDLKEMDLLSKEAHAKKEDLIKLLHKLSTELVSSQAYDK
jgi:predicted translin family RNA/ssDNA-binding protein